MSCLRLCTIAVLACAATAASAKLPALNDEAKAKAAEATARTAWSDKVGAFQLCKAQDRVAARYMSDAKKAGKCHTIQMDPTTSAALAGRKRCSIRGSR